jgi:hypothetical protein
MRKTMSAARVRLRPNTTTATRSVELETVISWRDRFDVNRRVAVIAVVKERTRRTAAAGSAASGQGRLP